MSAMGASAEQIAAAQSLATPSDAEVPLYGIWADTADAVDLFLNLATQWRRAGMSGTRIGLDYAGVYAYLQIQVPARKRRALFVDLQLMERAALGAMRELSEKKD